jgi:hypothetical protein
MPTIDSTENQAIIGWIFFSSAWRFGGTAWDRNTLGVHVTNSL